MHSRKDLADYSIHFCGVTFQAACRAGLLSGVEAGAALAAALRALRTHGHHDANQAALLALGVQVSSFCIYTCILVTMTGRRVGCCHIVFFKICDLGRTRRQIDVQFEYDIFRAIYSSK